MVPELEKLERYISGDLESSEKAALELVLRDDPILADAIDGLREVEDIKVVRASLARLYRANHSRLTARNKKREQLSKRKSRVVIMDNQPLFMGIAAGLVILIVSIFVIRKMNESVTPDLDATIAQNRLENIIPPVFPADSSESEEEDIETTDKKTDKVLPEFIADNASAKKENKQPGKVKAVVNSSRNETVSVKIENDDEEDLDDLGSDTSLEEESDFSVSAPKESKPEPSMVREQESSSGLRPTANTALDEVEVVSTEKSSLPSSKQYFDSLPPAYDTIKIGPGKAVPPAILREDSVYINYYEKRGEDEKFNRTKGQLLKAQALTDLMYQGVQAMRAGKYQLARDKFGEVIASSPKNVTAYFYLGQTEMSAGKYKTAIKHFRRNLNFPAAPIFEENKWYLAQAYIKAGKIAPAKKLLEEILNSDSPFKTDALTQLKDLE